MVHVSMYVLQMKTEDAKENGIISPNVTCINRLQSQPPLLYMCKNRGNEKRAPTVNNAFGTNVQNRLQAHLSLIFTQPGVTLPTLKGQLYIYFPKTHTTLFYLIAPYEGKTSIKERASRPSKTKIKTPFLVISSKLTECTLRKSVWQADDCARPKQHVICLGLIFQLLLVHFNHASVRQAR